MTYENKYEGMHYGVDAYVPRYRGAYVSESARLASYGLGGYVPQYRAAAVLPRAEGSERRGVRYRGDAAGFWKVCGSFVEFIPAASARGKRLRVAFAFLGVQLRGRSMTVQVGGSDDDLVARVGWRVP